MPVEITVTRFHFTLKVHLTYQRTGHAVFDNHPGLSVVCTTALLRNLRGTIAIHIWHHHQNVKV